MNGDVVVTDDLADTFCQYVCEDFSSRTDERFAFALSGGSSATVCYPHLATPAASALDWSLVDVFWGDERCVSFDDERSNAHAAHLFLLDKLEITPKLHPMNCQEGADAYDTLLRGYGAMDIIHLGLGPDGHTASLFPRSPALNATDRLVVFNQDPNGLNSLRRMTMTFDAIGAAQHVIITVSGKAKAPILARLKAGEDLPAQHIRGKRITWLLDQDAANGLA